MNIINCPSCHHDLSLGIYPDRKFQRLECENKECQIDAGSYFRSFVCSVEISSQKIIFYSINISINNKKYRLMSNDNIYDTKTYGTYLYEWIFANNVSNNKYSLSWDPVISVKRFYPFSFMKDITNLGAKLLNLRSFT